MKVMIVGGSQAKYLADRYYEFMAKLANGFTRNGHHVIRLYDKDMARSGNILRLRKLGERTANALLLDYARAAKPDLILFKHANTITNDTLVELRNAVPGVKLAQVNIDALFTTANARKIKEKAPYLDATFVTTGGDILDEISGGKPIYYLPNIVDPSVESGRAFDAATDTDVFLAVGNADADPHRAAFIKVLKDGLKKYKFRYADSSGGGLWGAAYMEAIAASKTAVNLSRVSESGVQGEAKHFHLYSSDRLSHLVGNGALVFSDARFNLDRLFSADEMVFYTDAEDLLARLIEHLDNDDLRRAKARAGWARAHRDYNVQKAAAFIEDMVMHGAVRETYGWPLR